MKKRAVYFVLFLTLALATLTTISLASDVFVRVSDTVTVDDINNVFYVPSAVKPNSVVLDLYGTDKITYKENGQDKEINKTTPINLTPFATTDENGNECYKVIVYVKGNANNLTFYFASTLPSVHISTVKGAENIIAYDSKDKATSVTIVNSDGTLEYEEGAGELSEIKVRGNTTNTYAKKPFALKLGHKAPLFGMSNDRQWILLANYLDQSLIRNSIMYKIAEILGMDMCDFQSVDLYLDGDYYGVYLLCEKVEIDNGRVNIKDLEEETELLNPSFAENATVVTSGDLIDNTILTEYRYIDGVIDPDDITGGYLVELDNNYYKDELCYFVTENNSHYVIKSPEYASKAQVEYIARLFAEMEEAIMSQDGKNRLGKHYSEYIDVDSFVYAYIVAELSRNYDAGSSSMYFYKEADIDGAFSKIVKGPLWDCDNTLGNIHKNDASNPEGFWAKGRSIWSGLTAKQEFNQRVTQVFASLYDDIFDMLDAGGFIDMQLKELEGSYQMERLRWSSYDYSRWPTYYDGTHYDRWQSSPVFNFVEKYTDGVNNTNETVIGYLCNHIEARANWLAKEWDCQVTVRERVLNDPITPDAPPPAEPTSDNTGLIIAIVIISSIALISLCVTVIVVVKRK